ncbi:Plant organelle RNA recognition domain-containing protein [Dioscorea alata]|uniref:Plant organelle RNA recognition domain-containing protein n=2 Tax=Dioscorea alata TaxID=55571 RepID=A0ACB7UKT9_DIOAL|nr:Plant organelle RNA recognition domain-containing protein [Dioscorea alata]KAH7661049.1 Plant organelle RNA recognition domain-containing protein [Dioscorea alata]
MLARCAASASLESSLSKSLSSFFSQSSSMSVYSSKSHRRPKKKIYHREPLLDQAMDLQKKPALLLRLRFLIVSRPSHSLLLRDLEKEVGFVPKWSFLSLIQRYTSIFKVSGGAPSRSPISVTLTDKAFKVSLEEARARDLMEPILVRNLRKLLMLSMDCRVPLDKIRLIESELGLPKDFEDVLIPKFPDYFSIKNVDGVEFLCLETWDSSLAVTVREERLDFGAVPVEKKDKRVPRDGNYEGPFAFKLKFPAGFRPNKSYLEEVVRWQKMAFPSPYLNARKIQPATPQARKRAVAVLHELLSLTMEKRLTSDKLDAFHNEYQLPCRLLLCLVKNHGIFYITNKGARSTVFLKEAYDGCNLIEKCPLLRFNDRFVALIGRTSPDLDDRMLA